MRRNQTSPAAPWIGSMLGAVALVLWSGCAQVVGVTAGELSENLALAEKGAKANKPAFNDGNEFTYDVTTSLPYDPDDPNWMEAEKYTAAIVELPEVTPIHKVIVKSRDLDRPLQQGMFVAVEVRRPDGTWETVRKWERYPPPKILEVNMNKEGDAVRVVIKRPPTLFSGGGGGAAGGRPTDNGERHIYEVEVYKYLPKDQTSAANGAAAGG